MMLFVEFQLKVGAVLAVGVLVFHLFLSKDVSFHRNRIWLLACLIVPWLVPLAAMPARLKTFLFGQEMVSGQYLIAQTPEVPSVPEDFTSGTLPWATIVLSIIGIVSLALIIRLVIGYVSVYRISRNADKCSYKGFKLRLFSNQDIVPFSFFRTIYAPKQIEHQKDHHLILDHELIHCKQWHSIDIMLAECLLLLQWWNPFAWWLRRLISQNHEYCVDRIMLNAVPHPKQYQYLMVDIITGIPGLRLVNNFNRCFTKKRIIMMNKRKSSNSMDKFKMIPIAMLLILVAMAFTDPDKTVSSTINQAETTPIAVQEANKDTTDMSKVFYIVDGVEMGYGYKVDPDLKIESVNVIKPPMSVELYGEKGNIGVLVVKTRNVFKVVGYAVSDSVKTEEVISVMGFAAEDSVIIKHAGGAELYGDPKIKVVEREENPLVIIDGKESTVNVLNKIDSETVKVVDVIKGEAAIEEYGDRGQHGVIKVTTKGNENESIATTHPQKRSMKIVSGHNLNEDAKTKIKLDYQKNSPLIFVDGKEMPSNTLDTIDPIRIESISVLKDQAATNLYGAKAAHGVILITLKK